MDPFAPLPSAAERGPLPEVHRSAAGLCGTRFEDRAGWAGSVALSEPGGVDVR
jgi:hypothetical protein